MLYYSWKPSFGPLNQGRIVSKITFFHSPVPAVSTKLVQKEFDSKICFASVIKLAYWQTFGIVFSSLFGVILFYNYHFDPDKKDLTLSSIVWYYCVPMLNEVAKRIQHLVSTRSHNRGLQHRSTLLNWTCWTHLVTLVNYVECCRLMQICFPHVHLFNMLHVPS